MPSISCDMSVLAVYIILLFVRSSFEIGAAHSTGCSVKPTSTLRPSTFDYIGYVDSRLPTCMHSWWQKFSPGTHLSVHVRVADGRVTVRSNPTYLGHCTFDWTSSYHVRSKRVRWASTEVRRTLSRYLTRLECVKISLSLSLSLAAHPLLFPLSWILAPIRRDTSNSGELASSNDND